MVPLAFGTQTAGSLIRPASYCGIVGFKPSYNAVPTAGVKPLSPTLDTVGPMTRTVADAILLFSVIACDRWAVQVEPTLPKRVGLCRTPAWPEVEPASAQALEEAARRLKDVPVQGPLVTCASLIVGDARHAWHQRGYIGVDMETGLIRATRIAAVRVVLDTPGHELDAAWLRPVSVVMHPAAWRQVRWLRREAPRCARIAADIVAAALNVM